MMTTVTLKLERTAADSVRHEFMASAFMHLAARRKTADKM